MKSWIIWIGFVVLMGTLIMGNLCYTKIDVELLADAIFKVENSKAFPYGIMIKYKHTTPRQACINTINHALKDWNGKGDFINFLADRYCPPSIDLIGNKNWKRNVKWFLKRDIERAKL